MNWKSTAAASGLGLLGMWLASYAPAGRAPAPSAVPSPERTASAAAEIQHEARRLNERLQQRAAYRDPERNPFRFGPRPAPLAPRSAPVMTVEDLPPSLEPQPPALRMSLAGIAAETADGAAVRTAIISTPADVLLVQVGDTVGGVYTVTAITQDAVQLARASDGTTVTLTLRP